jgi:NADPH-dependent 2,4-dienoyl-CoA reductase/sulfur reductase-like enzyme
MKTLNKEHHMHHVIIGNGPAGVIAAETIRKLDPHAYITLVGDEAEPPYSRMAIPYLLVGNIKESGTYLRKDANHWALHRINMVNARAEKIDATAKKVTLKNGQVLSYDKLLVATGSNPAKAPIPGIDSPGVHSCWTMADARKIIAEVKPGARVLQMGAGFIGCIIMESIAARGAKLTVVEMGDRMVPRMMTEKAGGMIKQWVEAKGVKVYTNTKVEGIMVGMPMRVKLSSGEVIEADVVISATGVRPAIGFLKDSGVKTNLGIVVDNHMQSSDANIFAAGDCAEALDFNTGKFAVNAIQPNAADQARVAAASMVGKPAATEGSLALNVLDTLGLVSTSFGQWWGAEAKDGGSTSEVVDEKAYKYLSLQFQNDVLIGATSLGMTDHMGVVRGLIQSKTKLGDWKPRLMQNPLGVMDAYLEKSQAQASNAGLSGARLR